MVAGEWTSTDAPDLRAVQPDAEGLVHGVDMHENMRNFFALRVLSCATDGHWPRCCVRLKGHRPWPAPPEPPSAPTGAYAEPMPKI